MDIEFDFNKSFVKKRRIEFAEILKNLSDRIGFKVSSRGWCYIMEQKGLINKNHFSKVENAINVLRKEGLLPVDFTAEEEARGFSNVFTKTEKSYTEFLADKVSGLFYGYVNFIPDYYEDEEYYLQMVVEKKDVKTLFEGICHKYRIPIANAKGWSSVFQRAEYCRRFKAASDKGLKCVLLYCGDHDPDGLRISETLRKNLEDVSNIVWSDGLEGYDPSDLIIDRFGLNYDFIIKNGFSWIDNLITGSKGNLDLSNKSHKNHYLPYVQRYLKKVGARKCEANVIVTLPEIAKELCSDAIKKYLGEDGLSRIEEKDEKVRQRYKSLIDHYGIYDLHEEIQNDIE